MFPVPCPCSIAWAMTAPAGSIRDEPEHISSPDAPEAKTDWSRRSSQWGLTVWHGRRGDFRATGSTEVGQDGVHMLPPTMVRLPSRTRSSTTTITTTQWGGWGGGVWGWSGGGGVWVVLVLVFFLFFFFVLAFFFFLFVVFIVFWLLWFLVLPLLLSSPLLSRSWFTAHQVSRCGRPDLGANFI